MDSHYENIEYYLLFICLFTFLRWSFSCDPGANKWRPKVRLHQRQLHSSTYTHIPIAFEISTQLQNIMISFVFNQKLKLACVLNPMHASWEEFPNLCEIKPKQKTYKWTLLKTSNVKFVALNSLIKQIQQSQVTTYPS